MRFAIILARHEYAFLPLDYRSAKVESEMKGYQKHNRKIVDGSHGSTRRGRLSHHASKYTYIYFVKHIYIN